MPVTKVLMMKCELLLASVLALVSAIPAAQSSTVEFHSAPSISFADGTFTSNLSAMWPDGFYAIQGSPTSAFNGYGQNGEAILFNAPVMLENLTIGKCIVCADFNPLTFGISLFHHNTLLSFTSISASDTPSTLTFNLPQVTKLEFSFTGGGDRYSDGRTVAWYTVSDINYSVENVEAVPLGPSTWPMILLGIASFGFVTYRRRKADTTVLAPSV